MARQVLTLPDVPSTLLTKSAADGFYLPLSHAPGTDPHTQYHNDTRGDVRYYTKTLGDARYAAIAHNHDAAYSPAAHLHTATYVDAVGDSMTGPLTLVMATEALTLNRPDVAGYMAFQGFARQSNYKWHFGLGPGDEFFLYNGDLTRAPINVFPGGTVVLAANDDNTTGLRVDAVRSSFGRAKNPPADTNTGNTVVQFGGSGILESNTGGSYVSVADNYYWSTANAGRTIVNSAASYLQQYAGNLMFANSAGAAPGSPVTMVNRFHVSPSGVVTVVSDGGGVAIDCYNGIRLRPHTSGLSGIWYMGPAGVDRLFVGMETNSEDTFRFYSPVVANFLSMNLTTGAINTSGTLGTGGDITVNQTVRSTGQLYLYAGGAGNVQIGCPGGFLHPDGDAIRSCGHPGIRWNYGYFSHTVSANKFQAEIIQSGSDGGQNIAANYHQFVKGGGGHIQVAGAGNFEPATDNSCLLGGSVNRWQSVWSNNGGIQTSHVSMKKNFVPLDPGECAAAVLSTDWLHFDYLEPEIQPATKMETPEERKGRYGEFARLLVETAPARNQKGYVLESPNHKTHPLFGLNDRKSSSPSSDLAVVAAALQFALQEIAQLKGELATRG